MHKSLNYCVSLLMVIIAIWSLVSCNNNVAEIPFPSGDSGFPQPITTPLKIGESRKIDWITVKTGGIKPSMKKVDFKKLPSFPYDADGFEPLSNPPVETRFDFNGLPETDFTPEKSETKKLHFKVTALDPPVSVKAVAIAPRSNTPLSIFDIGKLQGLPTKIIFALYKDKSGFMWIGTDLGLFRFDGENMQQYNISKGAVGAIFEDHLGRIWYMRRRGIGFIDLKHGIDNYTTELICPSPNFPVILNDDSGNIWITQTAEKGAVMIDPVSLNYKTLGAGAGLSGSEFWTFKDNNKNIWVSSNAGINIINTTTRKIKHLAKANGLSSDTLQAITSDPKGKIWVAVKNVGLNSIDIEKGVIKTYSSKRSLNNSKTFQLLYDNKDRIWVATLSRFGILDIKREKVKYASEREGIVDDVILAIVKDDRNRMWIASSTTGLYIIDQNADIVNPLEKKQIVSLFEDPESNIWAGTNEGVWILDGEKKQMKHLNQRDGLGNNFVQSFVQAGKKLWITTNGGFDLIDPIQNTIEHTGKNEGLINDTVYAVIKDTKGNTWVAGPSEGMQVYDSVKKVVLQLTTENGLSDNSITDVAIDNDSNIWVATYRGGVDIISADLSSIRNLKSPAGLGDTSYRVILRDPSGKMWIGTGKGLYLVDVKNGELTSITEGLSNNYITSLSFYKGSVVAGTKKGASIITPPSPQNLDNKSSQNDKWSVGLLAKSEGLLTETQTWDVNMVTGNGRFLWGANNGINIINDINTENDSALTYITGITLMGQPRYFSETLKIAEQDSLFSGDSSYIKGKMRLNSAFTEKGDFKWDSISGPFNLPTKLLIPHTQNYIQFQFAQLSLGRQDNILYSYILEGLDKNWSTPSNKTVTDNYLNLSPGAYRFKVRSKNLTGLWSKPAVFSFTITPPWWKTSWAYAIYIFLFGTAFWAFMEYRSRQLRRENRVLEEKVEHRTMQLQKSLEDLRSTQTQLVQSEKMASLGELTAGIAHEIQNPLNFVNNFSEVNKELLTEMKEEIDKGNFEEVKSIADDVIANEEKISQHGKRADSIVKGMLQHSRSSSGQKELTNINTLADEYFRLAYHGLRAKDKTFNATMKSDFDEKIGEVNVMRQDLGRVILNLITNAFYAVAEKKKQEPQGYEPTVSVSTKRVNGKIEIKVSDNGNGIPQKVIDKIFQPFFTTKPTGEGTGLGLSMSYDIVTKGHSGELKVETQAAGEPNPLGKPNGTHFIITIPV